MLSLDGHRRKFAEFYERLPEKENVFYTFFTGGLLHWVDKATRLVPDHVNLVLFGSALPDEEQQWIRDNMDRPFFHLEPRINDKIAWTFLFDTNQENFGWLDIDCLVLNPALFDEISEISSHDALNGTWWYDSGYGFHLAATYFVFFNAGVIRELRSAGLSVSPNCYSFESINCTIALNGEPHYSEVLTAPLKEQLLRVVPPDEHGRPRFPEGDEHYFDTTVTHQLMARGLGYGAHHVRDLRRRGWGGTGRDFEQISDELIHIGGISYGGGLSEFSRRFHAPNIALRFLLAEYVTLDSADRLPPAYAERRSLVAAELTQAGLPSHAAHDAARRHLTEERGLSADAAHIIVPDHADTIG
jgi:hypothetical protein